MLQHHQRNIVLDVNHLMADRVGHPYGISREQILRWADPASAAFRAVNEARGTGWLGWTELPYNQEEIVKNIEDTAKNIQERFDAFVVLGIGGSALGPIAVHQALQHLRYNELPKEQRHYPRFYVEDNIDPERMRALLDVIDVRYTCFNIITKSGATAETMSQYLIISDLLKKAVGEKWHEHIIATTDKEKGNLIRLAKKGGIQTLLCPFLGRRALQRIKSCWPFIIGSMRYRHPGLAGRCRRYGCALPIGRRLE